MTDVRPSGSITWRSGDRADLPQAAEPPIRAIPGLSAASSEVGEVGMNLGYYRLYRLAEPNGRFIGFEEIDAADDEEAARLAERHFGSHPLELWCGKRKVRLFSPAAS